MWAILYQGQVLDTFPSDVLAYEATYTGEYPDDCEVAYIG